MIRAQRRAARFESWIVLAPVQTIFPDWKINRVVRGSRIRIITAAKRFGLYSAFPAFRAMLFRSSLQPRSTVETIFLRHEEKAAWHERALVSAHCMVGWMPKGSAVRGVDGTTESAWYDLTERGLSVLVPRRSGVAFDCLSSTGATLRGVAAGGNDIGDA